MSDPIVVGTLAELDRDGPRVVRGVAHNIVVFLDQGTPFAVDNRCPHMGFPLERGSVKDGILTCHWHEARFDLKSGCTFDLWADDVLKFDAWVQEGKVWVSPTPTRRHDHNYYRRRLIQGIEQDVPLVQAKSLLALQRDQAGLMPVLAAVLEFATANLNGMTEGLHRLGCVVNLMPLLKAETAYQAALYATRQIARETMGAVPHRHKDALAADRYDAATLKRWLRQWVLTRHADATERTLLAGVLTLPANELADLTFGVASERLYADGGHLLEACNKAFEMADHFGGNHARRLFPLLIQRLTGARGAEESTSWHHPVELVAPLARVDEELPAMLANNRGTGTVDAGLRAILSGDDPVKIIDGLRQALLADVSPTDLAREVSYAAALRLARFATSNEVTDWFNPQHTYIHSHAVWQAVTRSPTPLVVRSVFQAAIAVYLDRFLNVPAAKLPSEKKLTRTLPADGAALLQLLLAQLDTRSDIDYVADVVARYLALGHPMTELIDCLAFATVREDLDFHSLQVLTAAAHQTSLWSDPIVIQNIMVGVVRALAAHCPTRRAGQQTALIAAKLQRGEPIYEAV